MDKLTAIDNLRKFVGLISSAGITTTTDYRAWAKEHKAQMAELFLYPATAGMPPISSLVSAAFHPQLPLMLFNYTQLAHNTLHEFPDGWTDVLRLCRGIVFDSNGKLCALPFPKFFNFGEHPETKDLPDEPFEATVKHDGHLGIIFPYAQRLILTTRGYFDSRTSVLGNQMLNEIAAKNSWKYEWFEERTLLVEIIHPETKVYLDYQQSGFIAIGGSDCRTFYDYPHDVLKTSAERLQLPIADIWQGNSLADLAQLMKDRSVTNQEGFVVRFESGLRVKFKFESYIGKMVADKLSYSYLLNRLSSGNAERMLSTLPEEILDTAHKMLGQILLAVASPGTLKDKWRRLYALVPQEERTSYFESVCRDFVKGFVAPSAK